MGIQNNGRHAALDGLATVGTRLAAYSANPGSAGTSNEISGGSPAYARKAVTFAASASGQKATNASVVFDVPAGATVAFFGLWDTGGSTFYGYWPNQGDTAADAQVCTLDAATDVFTSYAHGFTDGMRVTLADVNGAGLPTGFTEGDIYFVVNSTTNTFQLSATSGGSAITVTTSAEVVAQKLVAETFAAQGTLTIASGGLVLDALLT